MTEPIAVSIVNACTRRGAGGSPTAVLADGVLSEVERRRVPVVLGTSHAVFVNAGESQGIGLRFFTSTGELSGCGHGTLAALAFVAKHGHRAGEIALEAGGRRFTGSAVAREGACHATFDPGEAQVRRASAAERESALDALRLGADVLASELSVASLGRARLLVPVASRDVLAALAPDLERLRAACDRLGLLGCYVYTPPGPDGHLAARMFAPSIGVGEDIANANSTACLAARLAGEGLTSISVDMGDSLGHPATVTATARRRGRTGLHVRVGGDVHAARTVRLSSVALRAEG